MKKVVIGFSIVFVLVLISIFIYNLVKADNEVKILEDVISYQYELEEYFDAYGYTIDNPNVVIDTYVADLSQKED